MSGIGSELTAALLPDGERMAHVPCAALRRALWLLENEDLYQPLLQKEKDKGHFGVQFTLAHESTQFFGQDWSDTWESMLKRLENEDPKLFEEKMFDNRDLFIALAETDLNSFCRTVYNVFGATNRLVSMDLSRVMQAACVHSHWEYIKELADKSFQRSMRTESDPMAELRAGVERAIPLVELAKVGELLKHAYAAGIVTMSQVRDLHASRAVERTLTPRVQRSPASVLGGVIALRILTDIQLLRIIGQYTETAKSAADRFMETSPQLQQLKQKNMIISSPWVAAIIENDLVAVRALYVIEKRWNSFCFWGAMHVAACEGRLEILQWLHTLPGSKHKCRVNTMAMAARCGWANVVEWLHFHCPVSAISMSAAAINDAIRDGHIDVLRVCAKYSLGEFGDQAMHLAIETGNVDLVELVARVVPGCGATVIEVRDAIQNGHAKVLEFLHAHWPWLTQSVSVETIHEAVRRRHFDVVFVCLENNIGSFSAESLAMAVEVGDCQLLQLIKSCRANVSLEPAIDKAIAVGETDCLAWLLQCVGSDGITSDRLWESMLQQKRDRHIDGDELIRVVIQSGVTTDTIHALAVDNFEKMCGRGMVQTIRPVLTRVSADLVDAGLIAAVENCQSAELISLLLDCVDHSSSALTSVLELIQASERAYVVQPLVESGKISQDDWVKTFRLALADKSMRASLHAMIELQVDTMCEGAFVLLANSDLDGLMLMHSRRTSDAAIRGLRDAKDWKVALHLLAHEDQYYTKRVVLANAPVFLVPAVVRYFIQYPTDDEAVVQIVALNQTRATSLSVRELERVLAQGDRVLADVIAQRHRVLVDWKLWVCALKYESLDVLSFLHRSLAVAIPQAGDGLVSGMVWALRDGLWKLLHDGSSAVPPAHVDAVTGVLAFQSDDVQCRVFIALLERASDARWSDAELVAMLQRAVAVLGKRVLRASSSLDTVKCIRLLRAIHEAGWRDGMSGMLMEDHEGVKEERAM